MTEPSNSTMRITIVLPQMWPLPSGGLKIQFEYAGGLVRRGHQVTIVYPMSAFRMIGIRGTIRYAYLLGRQLFLGHRIIPWFELDKRVKLLSLPFLAGWLLPAADVTVLTAWQTAATTRGPRKRAGQQVQVVYDYEFWMAGTEEFRSRVCSALQRTDVALLSTSGAVANMIAEMNRSPVASVPAGIDISIFRCDVRPSDRDPVVGFAFRGGATKAMPVILEACDMIHRRHPDIHLTCYGDTAGVSLPTYIHSLGAVSVRELRDFYNRCMIFVLPSDYEGWGLPAAEALACGACLVTTANGGTEDFAEDGVNALVVPIRDPAAIAQAVVRLVEDRRFRLDLVARARETTEHLNIETAIDRLEGVLATVVRGNQDSTAVVDAT